MATVAPEKIENKSWLNTTWEQYLALGNNPDFRKAKIYHYKGKTKIEMSPLELEHSRDHSIIAYGIHLHSVIKNIKLNSQDNCTYQKKGYQGAQPDLSYYIGDNASTIPYDTGIVDLNRYPAPNLVVEIANSSLADDLGMKRLLYENLGTQEYWIVDVQSQNIIAFAIADGGSKRIYKSQILSDLDINILETALQKTRTQTHTEVGVWLLKLFQSNC